MKKDAKGKLLEIFVCTLCGRDTTAGTVCGRHGGGGGGYVPRVPGSSSLPPRPAEPEYREGLLVEPRDDNYDPAAGPRVSIETLVKLLPVPEGPRESSLPPLDWKVPEIKKAKKRCPTCQPKTRCGALLRVATASCIVTSSTNLPAAWSATRCRDSAATDAALVFK